MAARRVLVIDDSPTIHKVVAHTLKRLGIEVTQAPDGKKGIASARQSPPDAILLDFMMPGMNGYQVCKALHEMKQLERVPIVLMSAKGEMIGEKLVKTMGIVDYITKPFTPDAIATVIQHALDPQQYDPHASARSDPTNPLLPVGERSPEDRPTTEDLSDSRGHPALRGNLNAIPPGEVFQLLKFQQHTGILHLARGKAHLEVFLHQGGVTFARARNVEEEFLLGRFLIEVGAITTQDLDLFIQSRKGTNKLLGQQLVKLGHITQEQLKSALARQTEELLYEATRWAEGEFAFYVTEQLPAEAREAALRLPFDQILMEGYRRVDEWGVIEREIKDFDMVLHPHPDQAEAIAKLQLQPEEMRILKSVDGQRSIREIIRHSKKSSFEVCKILYRLLSSRILRKQTAT